MTRLTNKDREAVLEAVRRETVDPRYWRWLEKLGAACQRAANNMYPAAVRRWLDARPKEADALLRTLGSVTPEAGEDGVRLSDPFYRDSGGGYRRLGKVSLKTPVKVGVDGYYGDSLVLPDGVAAKLQAEVDEVWADWEHLRTTAHEAMHACTTHKQLKDRYPDLAKHLPKRERAAKGLTVTNDKVHAALACAKRGGCNK